MSEGYRRIRMLVLGWALCLSAAGGAESSSDCVHARFRIGDQWPSGYCVYVILENRTQQTVYNLGLQFRTTATINNSWVGDYHQSGGVVTVTFPGFAATLAPGSTHTESGFCAHGELPSDLVVLSGGVPLEPCNGCVIASLSAYAPYSMV